MQLAALVEALVGELEPVLARKGFVWLASRRVFRRGIAGGDVQIGLRPYRVGLAFRVEDGYSVKFNQVEALKSRCLERVGLERQLSRTLAVSNQVFRDSPGSLDLAAPVNELASTILRTVEVAERELFAIDDPAKAHALLNPPRDDSVWLHPLVVERAYSALAIARVVAPQEVKELVPMYRATVAKFARSYYLESFDAFAGHVTSA